MNEPRIFGPYTLLRRLAVGGMAEIHVAKTRGLGGFEKLVALKLVHPHLSADPHFVRMLIAEAKTVGMLAHANIAQVYDLGCIDETHYIAMEYVDGLDVHGLAGVAKQLRERLPIPVSLQIVAEMLNGLDYAHRKRDASGRPLNLVHRDVSPQNVMVSQAGEVKLVDFGIAKSTLQSERTEVGIIKGKYYYMSPEQAWGDPADRRSDVFSSGLLLHEMLTGEMVYRGTSIPQLIARVRDAQIPDPRAHRPELPAELAAVVMKALERDPHQRFQSAIDMGEALRDVQYAHHPTFGTARLSEYVMRILEERARAQAASERSADGAVGQVAGGALDAPPVTRRESLPERGARKPPAPRRSSRAPSRPPPTSVPPPLPASALVAARSAAEARPRAFGDHDDPTLSWSQPAALAATTPSVVPPAWPIDEAELSPTTRRASLSPERAEAVWQGARNTPALVPPPSGDVRIETIPPTPPLPDFHGPERRRKWMTWLTVVGFAVLGGLVFQWLWLGHPSAVLELVSAPTGASVLVDGKLQSARTPLKLSALVPGRSYDVEVDAPGYKPWKDHVRIERPWVRQIVVLKPLSGRIVVRSTPPGAEVLLDGANMGRTPLAIEDVGVVKPAHLVLRRAGYRDLRRDVELRDDALEASVDVQLVPLRAP
jgi:serine/threonine protein kinase